MSTPNFKNVNASKVFAVQIENNFDADDIKRNVLSETGNPTDHYDGDRSYPGQIFGYICKTIGKYEVTINLIIRSGYYDGANLDWEVLVETDTGMYEYKEVEVTKTVDRWINSKIKKVEKIFGKNSTPLNCVGIFSNGEAVYQKANV